MKRRLVIPPPVEWDFRRVNPELMEVAVLYEYARASNKLRVAFANWLDTVIEGKTVRTRLIEAGKAGARHPSTALPRCSLGEDHLWSHYELFEVIADVRPDFPTPWLTGIPVKCEPVPYSGVSIEPLANVVDRAQRRVAESLLSTTPADYLKLACSEHFSLKINWERMTVQDVVAGFAKWLRVEAKKHADVMRQRGKGGQVPVEPLKWLAALRLKNAGMTYPQVIAMLDCYLEPTNAVKRNHAQRANLDASAIPRSQPCSETGKRTVLPYFEDDGTFSNAIAKARKKLKEIEKPNADFTKHSVINNFLC